MRKYICLIILLFAVNAYATDPDSAGTYVLQIEDLDYHDDLNQYNSRLTVTDTSIIYCGAATGVPLSFKWWFPADADWYSGVSADSLYNVNVKFICRTDAATEAAGDTAMAYMVVQTYNGFLDYYVTGDTLEIISATWDTVEFDFNYLMWDNFYLSYSLNYLQDNQVDLDTILYVEIDSVITEWEKVEYYVPTYASYATYTAMFDVTDNPGLTLAWDANTEGDLSHYVMHYGFSSGNYIFDDTTSLTTISYDSLQDDSTYYFAVTAIDTNGYSSDFSNEIRYSFDPDTTFLDADFNNDGVVNYLDMARIAFYMGKATGTCDLDGDDDVDEDDWDLFVTAYLSTGWSKIGDDD